MNKLWKHFLKQMSSEQGSAAITAAVIGAGASAIIGYNSDSGGGYEGGGVVEMPQYGFTEPRLELTSDFYTQQIQNLMGGEAPPYLQKYMPKMKKGLQEGLQESYLGRPGERRGAIQLAQEMGSNTGLGPKASTARGEKQLRDYMTKSTQIDQYMAGIEFGAVQDAAMNFPNQSAHMPKGPNSQTVGAQQIPGQPNYGGQAVNDIMGAVPWEDMFNQTTTPSTGGYTGSTPTASSLFNQQYNAGTPWSSMVQ